MPSGSHGGSRGGHSSGGSRGGGSSSSFGGSRSSSAPRTGGSHSRVNTGPSRVNHSPSHSRVGHGGGRPSNNYRFGARPRHFHFGRHNYYISPRRGRALSAMSTITVILVFFALIGLFMMIGANSNIKNIKEDYNYYQSMIAYTDANPSRIHTATVTDCFKADNNDKWYIIYELPTESGGTLEGYSYSVYTMYEALEIKNAGTIQVAVNMDTITASTDSIPMDYRDMPLDRDGEYAKAQGTKIMGIVFMAASAGIVVLLLIIQLRLRFYRRSDETATQAAASSTVTGTDTGAGNELRCGYCNTKISSSDVKCPTCGANA